MILFVSQNWVKFQLSHSNKLYIRQYPWHLFASFCEIIAGRQSTEILFQDEMVTAFHDRFPRAPVHILIVPNQHLGSVNSLTEQDQAMISRLILTAQNLAIEKGLADGGYSVGDQYRRQCRSIGTSLARTSAWGKSMPMMGG